MISLALALFAGATAIRTLPEDPLKNPGFEHFYNNEYDAAVSEFQAETRANPQQADAWNHLAQGVLYREMFRNGALESELVGGGNPFLRRPKMNIGAADRELFHKATQRALELTSATLKQDANNIPALYANGVAHGLEANYLFLVEKAWGESLRNATAARRAHERINRLDSGFVDAKLIPAIHEYVVGCLPFYVRALGSLAGFHGDKEGGIRKLQEVANKGVLNRYDAQILLAVIYRREHRPQDALPLLERSSSRFPRNYLLRLEQVQLYSDMGDRQAAFRVLNDVDQLRRASAPGYHSLPAEKVKFLRGNLLFWYRDLDGALANLRQATSGSERLDLNTASLAWLRLGQTLDLCPNRPEALTAYQQVVHLAPESELAMEARNYLRRPYKRDR